LACADAKVVMIVNVTALEDHMQESISSLSFAQKVNQTRVQKEVKENVEWSSMVGSKMH
jgi:hypothetical protein